jgi:signal transduction histidine kinase
MSTHQTSAGEPDSVSPTALVRQLGHDFNNLFSIVLGGLSLLREELPDSAWNAETRDVYDDIVSATREAADVIVQLTAWAGRQALEPEDTDLNDLIGDLVPLLERALPDGVTLETELGSGPVLAVVDRFRLQHAVTELVANARDAMAEGGQLRIITSREPGPTVQVVDTGEGMDEQVLARCTSPYFSTRRNDSRRGMGLSVVDGFARASHGKLSIDTRPGHGTRVRLELPPVTVRS